MAWAKGAFLDLAVHTSSDSITIKMPNDVDVLLHQLALHSIFSY